MNVSKMLKSAAVGAGLGLGLGLLLAPRSGAETRHALRLAVGTRLAAWEARWQTFPMADIQLTNHCRWALRRHDLGDLPVRVMRRVAYLSGDTLAPADRVTAAAVLGEVPGLLRIAWEPVPATR